MESPILDHEETQNHDVELYSVNTIMGFAFFCSALFGGIMLYMNLVRLNMRKAANEVLVVGLLYTFAAFTVGNFISFPGVGIGIGIGGAYLMSYFFKRHVPNHAMYATRSIWVPLIIAIVLIGSLIAVNIWALS